MRNLAIITARSGSKGLPDKNILPLHNVPLLAWSVKSARESNLYEMIHLSTDSEMYADIGLAYGADVSFLRPETLSNDFADSWSVLRWVVQKFEEQNKFFDTITLLQPTSPMRTATDLHNAMHLLDEKKADAIVSVCPLRHSPLWSNVLPEDGNMKDFLKTESEGSLRQELPTFYRLNGAIYLMKRDLLMSGEDIIANSYAYVMPAERSIDIDTLLDFKIAELIMETGK